MKWFRRRGQAPEPEGQGSRAEVHSSPALGELLARLHPDRRLHVLDLGPAVGSNISFWSERFTCSVEVVDLYRSLPPVVTGEPAAAVDQVLPSHGEPVDLVLAWDVLNYLDRDQFRTVMQNLARRCRPGAALFLMIVTIPEMPREPRRYVLHYVERDDRGRKPVEPGDRPHFEAERLQLEYRVESEGRRPAPRFKPAEVGALAAGFSVDRSLLLRHGIQEFVMLRNG